jgi:molecular chaperone GrpE
VTRLIRDEWDKMRQLVARQDEEYRRVLREKEKALVDANAAVTSLQEDFERHRNRSRNEQEGMTVRANEELLRRVVPISDNFARALAASETATNVEAVLSGVKKIYRLFDDVLSQEGLVPIKAEKGDAFNPKVHEALMEIETIEVADDAIYEVVQRGYMLGGKVFRPALVKVAREPRA